MIPIIVLAIVIITLIFISAYEPKKRYENQQYKGFRDTSFDHSWRKTNPDGSFSIIERKGSVTITKTYEGGERYINGHRCCSADDMDRWYVKKGYCEGIERRLYEIEQEIMRLNTDGGEDLFNEWNRRYEEYRQLCIDHGLWNWVIEDKTTFIPTPAQESSEEKKKEEIRGLLRDWQKRMTENQVITEYLRKCPRKHAIKRDLLRDLSDNDAATKKKVQIIYRRLIKAKVIAEKENKGGKLETRIVSHRKKQGLKPLPPAVFHPEYYSNVGKTEIYKVDYTVAEPIDLDEMNNTCYFISKSSGETYRTSLEKCSCPAYCKGYACKHMVALAIREGYLSRAEILNRYNI